MRLDDPAPASESLPRVAGFSAVSTGEGTLVTIDGSSLVVPYTPEFVTRLSQMRRGLDLIDELLRSEHAPYLHARLAQLLEGVGNRDTVRLLDFGTGAGGSAVVLARLGFRNIVGIDIIPDYAPLWRQRLDEAGYPNVGSFELVEENQPFPMPENSFDVVLLNGVLEHLLPAERRFVLEEARRVLRGGGGTCDRGDSEPLVPAEQPHEALVQRTASGVPRRERRGSLRHSSRLPPRREGRAVPHRLPWHVGAAGQQAPGTDHAIGTNAHGACPRRVRTSEKSAAVRCRSQSSRSFALARSRSFGSSHGATTSPPRPSSEPALQKAVSKRAKAEGR